MSILGASEILPAIVRDNGGAVFDVKHPDYGAVGDGVVDDTTAIQLAYNAAKVAGGVVWFPAGAYRLTSALNCTRAGVPSTVAISFRGAGPRSTQINAQMTGAALFDCTGSSFFTFSNFSVSGNTVLTPTTAFLLARNSTAATAGGHNFENVHTLGNFSVAAAYGYGSEVLTFDAGCQFANGALGKRTVVLTSTNIFAQTSAFVTIASGAMSNTVFDFTAELYNTAASGNNDCLYLEGASSVRFAGFMYALAGRSFVYIDASVSASSNIAICDTMWDGNNTTYGVTWSGASGVTRVELDNIYDIGVKAFAGTVTVPTGGITAYGQDLSPISGLRIKNVRSTAAAYYRFYQVLDSDLSFGTGDQVYWKDACSGNRMRVDATKLTVDRRDFATGNTIHDLVSGAVVNIRESLNVGDASKTLVTTDAPTQRWETALTADRTVTLPSNATSTIGQRFRIVRSGLGAFKLTVQTATPTTLRVMPAGVAGEVEVEFDGSWRFVGYGDLSATSAAITAPTAPSAGYVQAEAAAMKTAVDAIRAALIAHGITL